MPWLLQPQHFCCLPDRLTARKYRGFLENVLPGLLEDVLLWGRRCGFSTTELQRATWKEVSGGRTQHIQEGGLDVEESLLGWTCHSIIIIIIRLYYTGLYAVLCERNSEVIQFET
jgi:hypothetical protein